MRVCLGLFVVVAACVPQVGGDEMVQVITYDEGHSPGAVPLTLESLNPLKTPEIEVFLGGTFTFMGGPMEAQAAQPFEARAERGVDGVLVPTDYLTLVAFCTLHHLDAARRYIDGLDVPGIRDVGPYKVFLHPDVSASSLGSLTDNMAYVRGVNWFLIGPEGDIDALPLACNRSVVAHEFGHAISFHSEVTDGSASADAFAIDEGFADVIGAGITSNAYGLAASIEEDVRDLNIARVYDPSAGAHERGAVLASVFWAYRSGLIATGSDVEGATNDMVRLALTTLVSFNGEARPSLVEFIVRAVELSPEPAAFCQRAPVAFPSGEVGDACSL